MSENENSNTADVVSIKSGHDDDTILVSIVAACSLLVAGVLLVTVCLWRRARTKPNKGINGHLSGSKRYNKRDSHHDVFAEDDAFQKVDPFKDCDNHSLTESHQSFVFRNYFDKLVTDPSLLEPTSPRELKRSESYEVGEGRRDRVGSGSSVDYSLSEASRIPRHKHVHAVVIGVETSL